MRSAHGLQDVGSPHAISLAGKSWTARLQAFARLCQDRAASADEAARPDPLVMQALDELGILVAPLSEPAGNGLLEGAHWPRFHDALRTIGRADLSIGRLFEGHCNAIDLVHRYGTPAQRQKLDRAVRQGAMMGVWGADGKQPLRLREEKGRLKLEGGKILASGAGILKKAVASAGSELGQQLVILDLDDQTRFDLSGWTAQGMRSSATGSVDLSGVEVSQDCLVGRPGDFMRQPFFSGGAWRYCAVHLGALECLVDLYIAQLRERQRGDDPYQLQRLAACVCAARTADFWTRRAARQLGLRAGEAEGCVALSNMTRVVTEKAALEVLDTVQRGLGLSSLMRPGPVERISRDLRTYLRQPVPDLAMADAARFVLAASGSVHELWSDNED